jgi:hypothetical protein
MAIDFFKARLPSETAPSPGARAATSPFGNLVRLLARQAAREVIASGLGLYRAAPHKAVSEISLADVGPSEEKWDGSDEG